MLAKKISDRGLLKLLKKSENISHSGELLYVNDSKVFFGDDGAEVVNQFDKWMASSRHEKRWIGISGSWRYINQAVVNDTALIVRSLIKRGVGIITGGALGVDFIATEIMLKESDPAENLRIVLPINKDAYMQRYTDVYMQQYTDAGLQTNVTRTQADALTSQIFYMATHFPKIIFDKTPFNEIEFIALQNDHYRKLAYNFRNGLVGYGCEGLVALCVNDSSGVQDTVRKLEKMKKPHSLVQYQIATNSSDIITDYSNLQINGLIKEYPLKRLEDSTSEKISLIQQPSTSLH